MKQKRQARLPKGWTLEEIEALRKHYDEQTDAEAAAEIEAALHPAKDETVMTIPRKLVPKVRKLISEHMGKAKAKPIKTRRVA